MTSPQFVLTTAGLAAASTATPSGPYVNIVQFKVGSSYGYTPVSADTGLHGTTLYTSAPRNSLIVSGDTIDIVCEMPANVGPFFFGEIGLYLPGNVLFALAVFPTLQQKFSLATDGIPHVYRFNCLIKLAQGSAVFTLTTTNQTDLLEVPDTGYVTAPDQMAQQPNALIVHETIGYSPDNILLFKRSSNKWTPTKFTWSLTTSLGPTQDTLHIDVGGGLASLDGATPKRYAIQTPRGEFRLIQSIVGTTVTLTKALGAPLNPAVDDIEVFEADAYRSSATATNYDFNELRNLINPILSGPTGTTAPTAKGYGQPAINAPAGAVPTFLEWSNMAAIVTRLGKLLNMPANIALNGFDSNWSTGNFTQRMRQLSTMNDLANRIAQYGTRVPYSTLDVFTSVTRTLNNYWSQVHHDIDVNWSTTNDAQVFFNSGGYIGFVVSCSAKNYSQSIQRAMFSQLGTIRLSGFLSESIGPLRITYNDGDGVNTDFGNCGYYGLSTSRRRVFAHRVPLGTDPTKQPDTDMVMVELYATALSATHLKLELWVTDSTGSPYFNFPYSDPAYGSYGIGSLLANTSITSKVVFAKASTVYLPTPGVASPSIATSPSSQW